MGEIDLTEAVRAASAALVRADPDVGQPGRVVRTVASYAKLADMAVRAAAPIIERAVRERVVEQLMVEQEGAHGGFVDGIWTAMAIVRGEATDA